MAVRLFFSIFPVHRHNVRLIPTFKIYPDRRQYLYNADKGIQHYGRMGNI